VLPTFDHGDGLRHGGPGLPAARHRGARLLALRGAGGPGSRQHGLVGAVQRPRAERAGAHALAQNKDLLIATARVEEFFGRYFSARGGQFPFAEAGGSAFRERMTEKGPIPIPPGVDTTFNYYEAFLGGSWEIDFWGKYRRASEAARAELFGTEEARRSVVLTLVSAVAGTYVDILALDKQLEITRRTVETRRQNRDLFQLRLDNGVIPEIDLSMAEAEYQDALARLPDIELAIARAENALSVLLGRNPGAIPRGLAIDGLLLPGVPSGLPSDLMERRPDIRAAEQALIAANAQIGVAKSLYFPTISLTGAFGSASTDLSDLFTGSAKAWNFGVPLTVPIFTAGRIGGEVKGAEAFQQQTLYTYLQSRPKRLSRSGRRARRTRQIRPAAPIAQPPGRCAGKLCTAGAHAL
jgi:outer membrane protein, multidrug efflux system